MATMLTLASATAVSLSRDPAHSLHSFADDCNDRDVFLEFDVVDNFLCNVDLEFIPKLLDAPPAIFLGNDVAHCVQKKPRNHHDVDSNAGECRENFTRRFPELADHAIAFD